MGIERKARKRVIAGHSASLSNEAIGGQCRRKSANYGRARYSKEFRTPCPYPVISGIRLYVKWDDKSRMNIWMSVRFLRITSKRNKQPALNCIIKATSRDQVCVTA